MNAVEQAKARGHNPEWDPPAALTAASRWTCACGATVIDYNGNVYGSAIREDCDVDHVARARGLVRGTGAGS